MNSSTRTRLPPAPLEPLAYHIKTLREYPEYIPTLAAWHQQQWQTLHPAATLHGRLQRLRECLRPTVIPETFLALGQQLFGSVALVEQGPDDIPGMGPWLASVYIPPQWRKRGIASALIRHAMVQAKQAGFETLFLFTPDQCQLYQRLGWHIVGHSTLAGHTVTLLRATL